MPNKHRTDEELAVNRVVGQNLKYLRKLNNLNQTKVGNALGVSFQQIQKYEKGKDGLSALRLKQLAEKFKVSLDVLIDPDMITLHRGLTKEQISTEMLLDDQKEDQEKKLTPQDAGYLKPQKDIGSLEEIKGRLKKDTLDWTEGFNDDDDNVRMSDKEHLNRQLRK